MVGRGDGAAARGRTVVIEVSIGLEPYVQNYCHVA